MIFFSQTGELAHKNFCINGVDMDPSSLPGAQRDSFTYKPIQNFYSNHQTQFPSFVSPLNTHLNNHQYDDKNDNINEEYDEDDGDDSEDEFIMGNDGKMIRDTSKRLKLYPNGRKRASKACYECQRRHTRCGFERPCERCKRLGLECVDVQSIKKRGRSQKKAEYNIHYQHTFVNNSENSPPPVDRYTPQQSLTGSAVLQPINNTNSPIQQQQPFNNANSPTEEDFLLAEIDKMDQTQFALNVDLTKNQSVYQDKMGVIVSQEIPNIQYVSDSILQKLGYASSDSLKSYYDLFIPLHVQWSMESIKEDRVKRATIMNEIENGTQMLRQSHLKTEHQGRALVIDKNGAVLELVTKCFRVYNRANPSKLEGVYTFLFWN
jgi:hypothetical protein